MSRIPPIESEQRSHLRSGLFASLLGLVGGIAFSTVTDPHNVALSVVFGVSITILALQISEYYRLERVSSKLEPLVACIGLGDKNVYAHIVLIIERCAGIERLISSNRGLGGLLGDQL